MPIRKTFRGVRRTRLCRMDGCEQKVETGAAYCQAHARTPEALDPDQVERAEAFQRFRARARRGQFDRLLEAPTRRMLEQAAAVEGFKLEIGALRYGVMRVLAEETDPTRLALALARLSNAGVRARQANECVEQRRAEEVEADWLDRVSEAMLGYTVDGERFDRSRVALRARVHQRETAERWEQTRRTMALREAEAAAAEVARRRSVEEDGRRRGWGTPVWDDTPGLSPIRWIRQTDSQGGADMASHLPPLPVGGAEFEVDEAAGDEDRHDAAVAARIADERSAAVRRWEAESTTTAHSWDGYEQIAERRVARGGR